MTRFSLALAGVMACLLPAAAIAGDIHICSEGDYGSDETSSLSDTDPTPLSDIKPIVFTGESHVTIDVGLHARLDGSGRVTCIDIPADDEYDPWPVIFPKEALLAAASDWRFKLKPEQAAGTWIY